MSHMVTCQICKVRFDRDKIQAVRHNGRLYSHYTCEPDKELVPLPEPKDKDLNELKEYAKSVLKGYYKPARVNKQIKEYVQEYGYTHSGILKSLQWWCEVKGQALDNEKSRGGLGIVPYIYNDAKQYYYNLYLAQNANKDKNIEEYKAKEKIVIIKPPKVTEYRPKLFNFESLEDKNEE